MQFLVHAIAHLQSTQWYFSDSVLKATVSSAAREGGSRLAEVMQKSAAARNPLQVRDEASFIGGCRQTGDQSIFESAVWSIDLGSSIRGRGHIVARQPTTSIRANTMYGPPRASAQLLIQPPNMPSLALHFQRQRSRRALAVVSAAPCRIEL
jgi:hypothetical protein